MSIIYRDPANWITRLRDQYAEIPGVTLAIYYAKKWKISVEENIEGNPFIGAELSSRLEAVQAIKITTPGCIAFNSIQMIATRAIELGLEDEIETYPVRIYAKEELVLKTSHLSMRHVEFPIEPQLAKIECDKLTLFQMEEEEPKAFELVKSWAVNDSMVTETIRYGS